MDSTPLLVHSASNLESTTIHSRDPDSNDTFSQKATVAVPTYGANYSSTDTSTNLLQPTYYGEERKSAPMTIDTESRRCVDSRNGSFMLQVWES